MPAEDSHLKEMAAHLETGQAEVKLHASPLFVLLKRTSEGRGEESATREAFCNLNHEAFERAVLFTLKKTIGLLLLLVYSKALRASTT